MDQLAGPAGLAMPGHDERGDGCRSEPEDGWIAAAAPFYFTMRKVSIFGGSNEIQKNIIAKHLLGLPGA